MGAYSGGNECVPLHNRIIRRLSADADIDDRQVRALRAERLVPTVAADTPVSRCEFYRRICGIPATVQPETGRITFHAGSVVAITMPGHLGQAVRRRMGARSQELGPIVSHPRSRRWSFLARHDIPDEAGLFAELFRLDVSITPVGAEIALPSPGETHPGLRVWVRPPNDTFRPSAAVVVETLRACSGRRA